MNVIEVKNIGTIGGYSIDGFLFTCDRCGITKTVPKKGINNVIRSFPESWVYVSQKEFKIESSYCRECGKEIGIGC